VPGPESSASADSPSGRPFLIGALSRRISFSGSFGSNSSVALPSVLDYKSFNSCFLVSFFRSFFLENLFCLIFSNKSNCVNLEGYVAKLIKSYSLFCFFSYMTCVYEGFYLGGEGSGCIRLAGSYGTDTILGALLAGLGRAAAPGSLITCLADPMLCSPMCSTSEL